MDLAWAIVAGVGIAVFLGAAFYVANRRSK